MILVIANICMEIDNVCYVENWRKFVNFSENKFVDLSIYTVSSQHEAYNIEKFIFSEIKSKKWFRFHSEVMFVSEEWDKIYLLSPLNKWDVQTLLIQAFHTHAVQRHMIQLHSSLIEHKGRGLMFLGPSGIGKTTQAELWNKYRDALIINGDIVFVQEKEECFLGWGTPWHGSSPYCENTSVPVHAMIVLKQAPENSIRELTGFEKVTAVSNSVFYPQWLENGMELCLETLDHLLSSVPVYELSCRPDEESVRLTEEAVFGRL